MHPVASAPEAPFDRAPARPRSRARAVMASILIGASVTVSVAATALPVPAFAKGPASLADLAEQVTDAVVNISASTTVEARAGRAGPQVPPGTPFEDLFEEFFNRRGGRGGGGGGDGDGPRQQRKSNSLGSGFIIDSAGLVVTNNHVIGDANDIQVILHDGTKLKAEIVGKDSKIDLAVLRVKPPADRTLKAVPFGDSDKMRPGDWVIAIGNPFGLGGSVSAGIVSARGRNIESGPYDNYIQTDAAINKGNSGGPLFNMDGEVIGINTAILSPTGGSVGIGFAVPSGTAKPVIDQLRDFGEVRRGWLGVRIQNVDDTTAEALNLKGGARGALVAGVDEKGPAKTAGIEVGDVILKFNGAPVKASGDLPRIVASTPVGQKVDVVVMRKGEEVTKPVTLGRLEDGDKPQLANLRQPEPESATRQALGLNLSGMTDELRKKYSIKDTVKGVVVTRVDPNSTAADKRIQPGEVIVEVGQESVSTPAEVTKRIDALKKDGRKSVLLLVAGATGDVRFVAVGLD
ncbi:MULTISPECIES: DegQ family serine endoprotease [Methylobacterium]|uniref:DegQ family serine endoprotease n=1 Tax=Methylobacterium TaxID=407 RepID=UPI00089F2E59|nr:MULTISPECIES: DegQ family serine endoprotease [Methylobacterium]MBN4097540.1 DegQ family serine endoprotease [Methylobacterium sp. OT2]UIN37629.1 DegQ family serine endoprotease [Methylobacterium oryzae]SEG54114.1 serine protease Do [Methylobacterium sp. 190mf]SFE63147.1 serine protease Do [Methylobacterium sp. 13MFTsu3.1M2]